jgi:hypothetical protein
MKYKENIKRKGRHVIVREKKKTPQEPVLERVWLLVRDKEVAPAVHEILVDSFGDFQ